MTMKKADIEIGGTYWAKVSGKLTIVRIDRTHLPNSGTRGWYGTNLKTGREVRVRSARRLRCRAQADHVVQYKSRWGDKV